VAAGVTVLTGTKVMDAVLSNDVFNIQSSSGAYRARIVAGCYGKRSNLDIKWGRSFVEKKRDGLQNFVGIKYHVRYPHAPDTIALHNFKDGYCGLSKVEDDVSCLCYLTTAKNLMESSNSISEMEERVLGANPVLNQIFKHATFLYDRPLTISQVSFSPKTQVEKSMLMLGDAAGLITPLCGNGMSMAMHASLLAMQAADGYLQSKISRRQMERKYSESWQQQFAKRLWFGRRVQQFFGGEKSTSLFLRSITLFPSMARLLINATHGKSF
jgi:flavin-dependent dehydrogenase